MPGFLKVDGSQKPIAVPYLKESGTWKPIAIGYIKVEGTWRIWYTAEVVDDFNRADSSSLGTASDNFSEWTDYNSAWSIDSNQALHDGGDSVDLAAVQMYKATTDVTVEVDFVDGVGLGVAFWVVDQNNWWAAIPSRRTKNNPGFYSCPSGFSLDGTICRRTTVYSATYQPPGQSCSYVCPSPFYYVGGGKCQVSLYPQNSTSSTGIGCRGAGGCSSAGGICYFSQTCKDLGLGPCNCVVRTTTCTCQPFGGSCSGCGGTLEIDASLSCVSVPGRYTCPQGGSLSGTTCTLTETQNATYTPPFNTYPSVLRIFESINGAVSRRFQSGDISGGDPTSIKLEASANNINVKYYSQTQVQGTAYESDTFTSSNANKGQGVGIVKNGNTDSNQGTKLDNFRAE